MMDGEGTPGADLAGLLGILANEDDDGTRKERLFTMLNKTTGMATAILALGLSVAWGEQIGGIQTERKELSPAEEAYNEGVNLLRKGDLAGARDHFQRAVALQEDFAEAHNNLGYCLRKLGEEHYEAALGHYNRAIELKPKLAEAYMYRGVLYVLMGEKEKAEEDLKVLSRLRRKLAQQLEQAIETGKEPEGTSGVARKRW